MKLEKGKTIAVIGAGIIGITLARALQKKGYQVKLFDPEDPAMGASFGNAGYIATSEIFPLSHGANLMAAPDMLMDHMAPLTIPWKEFFPLLPWFYKFAMACRPKVVARGVEALAAIHKGAGQAWEEMVKAEQLGNFYKKNGALKVFETKEGFREVEDEREAYEKYGIEVRELKGKEVREMIPEMTKKVKRGLFFPDGAHVTDPYRIAKKVFDNFVMDGGIFLKERARFLEHEHETITHLVSNKNRYKIDAAVVCAGHLSGAFLEALNYRVPIVAERGYHLMVEHKPLSFDMPFGSYERGFFITPMAGGLRLAGTVEFVSATKDVLPNWERAKILKKHAKKLLPGVTGKVTSQWLGSRPTLPDFLPVMGPAPLLQNLFLNFGHQHLGLTLSAVSAKIMTDLISTGNSPIDLTPFDICRFQRKKKGK